ncbi:hypothetical protein KS4_13970 [Poriferisphaera corsica]|uniref:Uncharacterized protein n=1 Tax=Poriferisphaera corsica TaxID=2528020 RepID=A0A517YT08_9BACT|nr:hypothetical protein KS4_13970 [Poriferisphaera corsica]
MIIAIQFSAELNQMLLFTGNKENNPTLVKEQGANRLLDATFLAWAATIVRNGSVIFDRCDLDTS